MHRRHPAGHQAVHRERNERSGVKVLGKEAHCQISGHGRHQRTHQDLTENALALWAGQRR
ncbi:Uncharacterised protein [Mycobacteroides abscessus subsp. abscessus]|nr:Uncharacterised protein [Mycobacteroides abscessus subsp. abscessus]